MRTQIIAALLIAAGFFAIGKYTTPDHVITKEVEKKVFVEAEKKHEDKTTTIIKKPDGTTTTTITSKIDTNKNVGVTDDKNKSTEIFKNNPVNVSFLYSIYPEVKYGLSVSKQLIGPFTLGLVGITSTTFSDKSLLVSLGVNL